MMKHFMKIVLMSAFLRAFALAPSAYASYAADETGDPDTSGSSEIIIPAGSVEELIEILGSEPGANGPVTVQLEKADTEYALTKQLTIPEKVTLDLNGQTLKRTSGNEFIVGLSGQGASIKDGTIKKGGIRVYGNDSTGTISGIKILGSPTYGIRLQGSSIGDITDNTITDTRSHSISLTSEASAGDIKDNILTDSDDDGISLYHSSHCGVISGNTLKNIGDAVDAGTQGASDYGIILNNGQSSGYCYAKEITNNKIDSAAFASIVLLNAYEKDLKDPNNKSKCFVKGDIAYNTITRNATYKKRVKDWNHRKKTDPTCEGAIFINRGGEVRGDIHHNKINTSYDDGIDVLCYATVRNIYSNTINTVSVAGIAVGDHSKVTGSIYSNTITSSKGQGIFINTSSNAKKEIKNNKIVKPAVNGIFVTNRAKANIVKGNTITKAGMYGVIAGNKGKIKTLASNTISVNNARKGMGVLSNSKCSIAKIKSNKITGKYNAGIRIKAPTTAVYVISNVLVSSTPSSKWCVGISVADSKKTITIKKNKITGNKTASGIYYSGTPKSRIKAKGNSVKRSTRKIYPK